MKTGPKPRSLQEAWEHLLSRVVKVDDCWLLEDGWPIGMGYRRIQAGGHSWYAHHLAYYMAHGHAPADIVRRHTCDRANCINPAHIVGGTHADNVRDKVARGRQPKGSSHVCAVLTEAQVRAIRNSLKNYAELSREYGISRGGIHNIKTGRSWNWLK